MMRFNVLDHIRDGGSSDNTTPNDDWIGFEDRVAIVADGATGLGDHRLVMDGDSDAQWIAKIAVEHFVGARADDPVRELVREINSHALAIISNKNDMSDTPRYAWPSSSFIMARLQSGLVEISGLGDCSVIVEMSDGYVERFSALPFNDGSESRAAQEDFAKSKSQDTGIRSPEVIQSLRNKRERQNTIESGVWTLGLVPDAAEQVYTIALPMSEIKTVLLASDGFTSACDDYDLFDHKTLLKRAKSDGLGFINSEIRRVERLIDPKAVQFPRYKQSDDSSAILLELTK